MSVVAVKTLIRVHFQGLIRAATVYLEKNIVNTGRSWSNHMEWM